MSKSSSAFPLSCSRSRVSEVLKVRRQPPTPTTSLTPFSFILFRLGGAYIHVQYFNVLTPTRACKKGLPVDNMTAQSYVYGLGEGTSPSPGHRPVTRPARTWDYVVRVLTAWPPTRTESHNNEDERRSEEDAPV